MALFLNTNIVIYSAYQNFMGIQREVPVIRQKTKNVINNHDLKIHSYSNYKYLLIPKDLLCCG